MLVCFDKAERHLPNRCLRQYGMLQSIPENVPRWERKSRGVDGGVDLSMKMQSEVDEWSERRSHIVEGDIGADENDYMQWYLKITRKFVGRPISLSSEFQRTNAGLRDIAHIADTFSTKGLDPQQIELVSRIRCIAHECLRDQVGGPAIATATPHVEVGKRVRGKERVRRKSTGKRLRKDEPVQYSAASEDDQSHFGVTVEIAQLQLHHPDREENHPHLYALDNADNPLQIIHADCEDETMNLCSADIEIDHSSLNHATVEVVDAEMSHASGKDDETQFLNETEKNDDSQPCAAMTEVKDSQLPDEMLEVEPQHFDAAEVVNPQHNEITKEVVDSQLSEANKEVTDSQLSDAAKEVIDSQQNDTTQEVIDSQLSGATKELIDSQLSGVTKEVIDSQLSDSKEVINSQLPDVVNNVNGSQLSHVTSESDPETAKAAVAEVTQQSSLETSMEVVQPNGVAL